MRRLAFAAAVCGTLVLAACNDQTPTEPAVPPAESFGARCGPLVLAGAGGIAEQINNIYSGTTRPTTLLRAAALAQAVVIKGLWDTCHPEAAKKAAFFFIDWLNRHTPDGKGGQVQTLIIAILTAVGEIDPALAGDFGVGVYDPNNTTVITTVNHHALIQLEPGSFLVPTVIAISRRPDAFPLVGAGSRKQYPPVYDYNAINSTNTHTLVTGHTAIIAFCLQFLDPAGVPGVYPAGGYAENLRIGHNPFGGGFEILDEATSEDYDRSKLTCPYWDDSPASAGGGLLDFANAALRTAGRFLLPQPLWAATLGTLPPPPPLNGKAGSLSPFKPVEGDGPVITSPN